MSASQLDVGGRKVAVRECGRGDPLLYLHGFADVHGVADDLQPFHLRLGEIARLIAPAHPGCAGSDELGSYDSTWSGIASAAGSPPNWPCAIRIGCGGSR